jgi:hypothetical protein
MGETRETKGGQALPHRGYLFVKKINRLVFVP